MSDDIEEMGEGHVIVSRKHTGGRVSMAFYLVDIWCVGVKDSFYRLRLEDCEFKVMMKTTAGYTRAMGRTCPIPIATQTTRRKYT